MPSRLMLILSLDIVGYFYSGLFAGALKLGMTLIVGASFLSSACFGFSGDSVSTIWSSAGCFLRFGTPLGSSPNDIYVSGLD